VRTELILAHLQGHQGIRVIHVDDHERNASIAIQGAGEVLSVRRQGHVIDPPRPKNVRDLIGP
jgi:hypothetical protein